MPISQERWIQLFGEQRRIGFTRLWGEMAVEVSTVWLGLNHNYGSGRPLIFETMVFGGELDNEMDRYSTLDEAIAGHQRMVERVQVTMPQAAVEELAES